MLVGAAVCPSPPLLLREVTGAAEVAPDLREACRAAVRHLLSQDPDVVVVVGADGPAVAPTSFAPSPVTGRSVGGPAVPAPSPLPLSLLVGSRLLEEAGWRGPVRPTPVPPDAAPAQCAALGAGLRATVRRTALLVTGDGSARRGLKAPGYVDERAHAFDADVVAALRDGDARRLASLDPQLGDELLVAGRPAWQVLAAAMDETPVVAELLYADDPFGVMYVVATWTVDRR